MNAIRPVRVKTRLYVDQEVMFHLEVYSGYFAISDWCLKNVRKAYPWSRIIVTSDGDPDLRYREFEKRHWIELRYGSHLWGRGAGGKLWGRRFQEFLAGPERYLLRMDSDAGVYRRLSFLPEGDCIFGTFNLENGVGPFGFIQGGAVGVTRGAAEKIARSGLLKSDLAAKWNHVWRGEPMASDDKSIAAVALELKIPLYDHPEFACQWKERTPNKDLRYSIVHPCKDAKL